MKLFHRLKLSGLLSFGPDGIDLPMERLNVLIGPNGSGKSNLLEAVSLLQAAPRGISEFFSNAVGIREWSWQGESQSVSFTVETSVSFPPRGALRHLLTLIPLSLRPMVVEERVEPTAARPGREEPVYCQPPQDRRVASRLAGGRRASAPADSEGGLMVHERQGFVEFLSAGLADESLLYHVRSPVYPALLHLSVQYKNIRLYRNWSFGPNAKLRQPCSAHARSDFLDEGGENLPLVLSHLHGASKKKLLDALRRLFDGIVDFQCPVTGGMVSLFLEESGGRSIPATRLSDGTLRYLCLLAVLLHPEPPPLIGIEEPELGLHPDLLPGLADLLVEASERTQLIVTTHSDVLVDALTERPESIVVCEKHDGQTRMRRLDKADLAKWLKDYRLGDLWTSGELGGNRW